MADELTIIRQADGALTLEGVAPDEVAFQGETLVQIRAGGTAPWCTIELSPDGAETVVMRLCPLTLRYRLTGDIDATGSPVARRVDEDGTPWAS